MAQDDTISFKQNNIQNRSRSTTAYNETYFVLPNIGVAAI